MTNESSSSSLPWIITIIVGIVFIGALVALGIYFSAATRECSKNEDCLSGVIGYGKCFIKHGETKGKCKECGINKDCPSDKPYCIEGKCEKEAPADFKCNTDVDCPNLPGLNKCFSTTHKCGACNNDPDCPTATPFCVDGKCTITECSNSSDCSGTKLYCVNGVCSGTCTEDTQCADGQKCVEGSCRTSCTDSSKCSGTNPYCGPDGYCISTNCADDSECASTPATPRCIKAEGATRGVCKPIPCATNQMDCGNPYSKDGALRCMNGDCVKCSDGVGCGTGFSCYESRCIFDPISVKAGAKWKFYSNATVVGLKPLSDPEYTDNAEYDIRDLIVKADDDKINVFTVSNYSPTTGKGKVRFYSGEKLDNYTWTGTKNAYNWTSTTTLTKPSGIFVTTQRPVSIP